MNVTHSHCVSCDYQRATVITCERMRELGTIISQWVNYITCQAPFAAQASKHVRATCSADTCARIMTFMERHTHTHKRQNILMKFFRNQKKTPTVALTESSSCPTSNLTFDRNTWSLTVAHGNSETSCGDGI